LPKAIQTDIITAIGFGDYVPNTTGARVFSFFYDTIGILNLALLVGTTRETVIEGFENSYRKRRAAMSQRRKEHKFEKARAHARRVIIERMLKEAGLPLYVNQTHARGRGGLGHVYKVFNEQALGKDAIKAAELEACEVGHFVLSFDLLLTPSLVEYRQEC
jgi:potassium channel subfamily K